MSRDYDGIIAALASLETEVKNISKKQDLLAEEVKDLIDYQTQMKGAYKTYKVFIGFLAILATVVGLYYTITKSN